MTPSHGPQDSELIEPTAAPPRSLETAVKLMFLGAALTFFGVVYSALNTGPTRSSVVRRNNVKTGSAHLDAAGVDGAVHIAIGVSIAFGILGIGLWIAMAILNRQGRRWARLVATGLCVFSGLSFIYAVPAVGSDGGVRRLAVSGLNLAIGVAVLVLMYRPQSTVYYTERGDERAAAQVAKLT